MPFENIRPESHQVNEFNFDSSFVSSDKSDSQILGQGRYPTAKSDHRPEMERRAYSEESTCSRQSGSFGTVCCLFVIGDSSRLTISSCPLMPMMKAAKALLQKIF